MGEIRIVGPGKTRGYPYPVCKKIFSESVAAEKTARSCREFAFFRLFISFVLEFQF